MQQSIVDLLEFLQCPYCDSKLAVSDRIDSDLGSFFGILECDCYRYAVLHDIPVLRQLSGIGSNRDPVVERLESRDIEGAMRAAGADFLSAEDRPSGRLSGFLKSIGKRPEKSSGKVGGATGIVDAIRQQSFRDTLYRMKYEAYADYLYHRFANNSYMAAVVFLMLLHELADNPGDERPMVLDLACGIGHTAHLAQACNPNIDVIGVDFDFGNLCLAKNLHCTGRDIHLS